VNAVLTYVHASDFRWLGRLQACRLPRWFRLWMLLATRLADGWIYGLAAIVLAAQPGRRVLAAACLASAVSNLLLVLIKRRVRRLRPCDSSPDLRASVRAPDRWSFPSGHSVNAFSLGTLLSLAFPASGPFVFAFATSVAASRVVLGVHFVSDVVAGSLLGATVGGLAYAWLLA